MLYDFCIPGNENYYDVKSDNSIRPIISRFRERRSSVMEVILVLTHSHWWDKANTTYMEYVVYICFRMSFALKYLLRILQVRYI